MLYDIESRRTVRDWHAPGIGRSGRRLATALHSLRQGEGALDRVLLVLSLQGRRHPRDRLGDCCFVNLLRLEANVVHVLVEEDG